MDGNLNKFRVGKLPTVICKPDFITENEEKYLLDKIYEAPLSKWKSLKNRRLQNWGGVVHEKGLLPQDLPPWLTKITERIYEESGLFPAAMNHVLINEYLPHQGIMPHQDGPSYYPVVAILSLGSPVVMDFIPHSRLRTSCVDASRKSDESERSGDADIDIETDKWRDNHHPFSVLLSPRSLLIFKDDAYADYLHGIKDSEMHKYDEAVGDEGADDGFDQALLASEKTAETTGDREYKIIHRSKNRVSLTCRLVQKVHKNLFKF